MRPFAELLDRLSYTPARTGKLRLMGAYFRSTPDPDRGWALAALTGALDFDLPVRATLAALAARQIDDALYRYARDYVGDTAETVALIWPEPAADAEPPPLADVIAGLRRTASGDLATTLSGWLDRLDARGRWALLKLLTGAPRVGVSTRLAKVSLAEAFAVDINTIEEVWHGLAPPFSELFAWLEGKAPPPDTSGAPVFRPVMLAEPLSLADWTHLELAEYQIEWKWDGARVQIATGRGEVRLYSRSGDDITPAFPDIHSAFAGVAGQQTVLDGELLIVRGGTVAPFNDLQQRLNRKVVATRLIDEHPAHVRLYDALLIAGEDIRAHPLDRRRAHLASWHASHRPPRSDLSTVLQPADKPALEDLWRSTREAGIEGLMLKRRTAPYLVGRPAGQWYKWKRAPLTADCVLMYAQRGSGKRSSYFSDLTFGVWQQNAEGGEPQLIPVGKSYSGFTDAELRTLDRWVRDNTVDRFGPVRSVRPGLVLEIAFDAVQPSSRHKSGLAMRFPRIHRIRWDKPATEADRLEALSQLVARSAAPGEVGQQRKALRKTRKRNSES